MKRHKYFDDIYDRYNVYIYYYYININVNFNFI